MDVEPELHDLDIVKRYYEMFLAAAKTVHTTFFCPGAEPLLHPQFCRLLHIALDAGIVMLRTNLSIPIGKWMPHKPEALTLHITLHPPAEEGLTGFTDRVLEAMDLGIGVRVFYLNHPYQAHKLEGYTRHFASAGVPFKRSVFQGEWEGKHYPLKKVKIENPKTSQEPKMCAAGWNYAAIGIGSKLQRCMHNTTRLDGLLSSPTICQRPGNCPGKK
jgi:hypothetical protein